MSSHPSSLKKDITADCTVLRVLILSASFFKSFNKMSPEAIYEDREIKETGDYTVTFGTKAARDYLITLGTCTVKATERKWNMTLKIIIIKIGEKIKISFQVVATLSLPCSKENILLHPGG